jgi:hypothetical protein
MASKLVLESGGATASRLSDDDVEAAISEATEQAAELVAAVPEIVTGRSPRCAGSAVRRRVSRVARSGRHKRQASGPALPRR